MAFPLFSKVYQAKLPLTMCDLRTYDKLSDGPLGEVVQLANREALQ